MRIYTIIALLLCMGLGLASCKNDKDETATTERAAENVASQPLSGAAQDSMSTQGTLGTAAPFYFQCGDTLVQFTPHDDGKADMAIENTAYAMEQTISASGARYQNLGDDSTIFWNKGEQAWVTIDGVDLPECMRTSAPAKPEKPYQAQGNEPGWTLLIENNILHFTADYGDITRDIPIKTDESGGDENDGDTRTITGEDNGDTISATITAIPCIDSMSGEAFAHSVTIHYNDDHYEGCGKSLIRGITWRLEDLNNEGVIDNSHLTLTFGYDGRLSGNAGCNGYGGSYTLEGETLSIGGNLISTMRACIAESMMQQEQKFLRTLPLLKHATIDGTGALLLSSGEDASGEDGIFMRFRTAEDE